MNNLPSTIYCSFEPNRENDDHSELTWSYEDKFNPSSDDKQGVGLTADPYFYHTLKQKYAPISKTQELIEIKLQLARQQEKIDTLSSKLCDIQVENEALEAKNATLVTELASEKKPKKHLQAPEEGKGEIAKLEIENDRLNVVAGVTKKSFLAYIKTTQRKSIEDEATIAKLREEFRKLDQQRKQSGGIMPRVLSKSTMSRATARTASCSSSSDTTRSIQEDIKHLYGCSTLEENMNFVVQEKPKSKSGICRRATVSNDIQNTRHGKQASKVVLPRRATMGEEMLVDFGETQRSEGVIVCL